MEVLDEANPKRSDFSDVMISLEQQPAGTARPATVLRIDKLADGFLRDDKTNRRLMLDSTGV